MEVWLAGKEKFFHASIATAAQIRTKARTVVSDNLIAYGSLPKMSPALMDKSKKAKWRESNRSEIG